MTFFRQKKPRGTPIGMGGEGGEKTPSVAHLFHEAGPTRDVSPPLALATRMTRMLRDIMKINLQYRCMTFVQ